MGKEVNEILKERGKVHGDWANNAIASANLYRAFTDIAIKTGNSGIMPPEMTEAIRMALHKLGRIASGDPFEIDHWQDAIGYLTLARNYVIMRNAQATKERVGTEIPSESSIPEIWPVVKRPYYKPGE